MASLYTVNRQTLCKTAKVSPLFKRSCLNTRHLRARLKSLCTLLMKAIKRKQHSPSPNYQQRRYNYTVFSQARILLFSNKNVNLDKGGLAITSYFAV